ncbi:MAG: ATP-binding protein [Clostridiales bacterium]
MRYHNYDYGQFEQIDDLLHNVLDGSSEYAIIVTDLEDNIILWNKGAELIYGYTTIDMLGKQIPMDLLHKTEGLNSDIIFSNTNTFKSSICDYKMEAVKKDGSSIPVSVTVTPRINRNNETVGFLILSKDITKLKLEEQFRDVLIEITHLVNSSTEVTKMCESIVDVLSSFLDIPIVFICLFEPLNNTFSIVSQCGLCSGYDKHTCIYTVNESWIAHDKKACFLSYSQLKIHSENLSSHSIANFVCMKELNLEDISIIHVPLLSDIALIGLLHIVVPIHKKQFLLSESQILSLIANEIAAGVQRKRLEEENRQYSENLERMVIERTDELRKKDAQLVQSGKLATLGEMATGIAHEINQPLGAINLMAQGLLIAKRKNKCSNELLDTKLNSVVDQIDRISKIIAHLRTFARQSNNTKQELNVNNPIQDVFKLIGEQLKTRNIVVKLDLDSKLNHVLADHNKLEQVFLNIIGNARDALGDFEKKVIQMNTLDDCPKWLKDWEKSIYIKSYNQNDDVCVDITDNASGIDKQFINKIFEPFYTTKEVGKGTGLGLSISYGIIKDFDGTIEVDSESMKGSTFTIRLPSK